MKTKRTTAFKVKKRKWLYNKLKQGLLTCEYCGQIDLILNHRQDPDIPLRRRATVDHIIPLFAGGLLSHASNWCVACEECNKIKNQEDWEKYR